MVEKVKRRKQAGNSLFFLLEELVASNQQVGRVYSRNFQLVSSNRGRGSQNSTDFFILELLFQTFIYNFQYLTNLEKNVKIYIEGTRGDFVET